MGMKIGMRAVKIWVAVCLHLAAAGAASAQISPNEISGAQKGFAWEAGHSAAWHLAQHRKLAAAIATLRPQRPGIIDAYVIVIGLDSDPVFGREAAEAAKVLARRYDAVGRTILLASGVDNLPDGSPSHFAVSLAAIAAKMNTAEDAIIIYATAHGAPGIGVVYRDGEKSYGTIAPLRISALLDELGIKRRMTLISACYSGQFIGGLANRDSVIVTASDDDRTSFGCAPANDWTFFGDALINTALRKAMLFEPAAAEAFALINEWEVGKGLTSSKPRIFVGDQAKLWLAALEKRIPPGTTPKVGRPSVEWEAAKPVAPAGR